MLAVAYGAFVLGFGIGLWQALIAATVGAVVSFFLVGLVSIAGKRGSAPTLVLSRAPFGRYGNTLPALVSYLLLVGWETVLVALSTLATATVFERLGWAHGNATKVVAFVVVAAIIVLAGIMGFDLIMRLQKYLTLAMIVVTAVYVVLAWDHISLSTARALPTGSTSADDRRRDPGDDRLRDRLGEHRRRLLALPPPRRLDRRGGVLADARRQLPGRRAGGLRHPARRVLARPAATPSAPTRSAR